jgi:hypothetical protein
MNVPLYAVALLVFALAYLWFFVFLAFALLLALSGMAAILAIELGFARRRLRGEPMPGVAPAAIEPLREQAAKELRRDEAVTAIFITVTWGIFWGLNPLEPYLGRGLTDPSASASSAPPTELWVVTAAWILVAALVGAVGYARFRVETERRARRLVPPPSEPAPLGTACEFERGLRLAMLPTETIRMLVGPVPEPDDPDVRLYRIREFAGAPVVIVALCARHQAQVQNYGRLRGTAIFEKAPPPRPPEATEAAEPEGRAAA